MTHTYSTYHITHVLLLCIFSLTHLFSQVVHNSHDAGQLSVLLFGGTLPLALLLGAGGLLWRGHPGHVSQINVTRSVKSNYDAFSTTTSSVTLRCLCCRSAANSMLVGGSLLRFYGIKSRQFDGSFSKTRR